MTSTTQQVQVQVPAGVGPGVAIQVSNPMAPGQMFQVIVPAGMKTGDTFAVTLPASQPQMVPPQQQMMPQQPTMIAQQPQYPGAVPYQAGPPAGGQPHQVLIQMQGVPTSAVIPAIDHEGVPLEPGHVDRKFRVATATGQIDLVCPRVGAQGFAPGQQIQFLSAPMVGVPTAPRPPDDTAVAKYEQLLASATRITVHDMRRCSEPTIEMAALRMFGKTASGNVGELGTLYLVINEPAYWPANGVYVNCTAALAGSAELQLSDGCVVMQLANPEWRGAQIDQEVEEKKRNDWLRPEVQMMDREDLVRVTDESVMDEQSCCRDNWAPLDSLPQTRVSHPQSADETLKQGYQLVALASENSGTTCRGKFGLFCCPIAFCMAIIGTPAPDVHYQLKEVRSGNTVEGVLYTEKGRGYFQGGDVYKHGRGACVVAVSKTEHGETPLGVGIGYPRLIIPDGDTLTFDEPVPLQVRKDMLAALVHRMTFNALGGVPTGPGIYKHKDENTGGGG